MNIILLLICFVEFVRDISECCEVGYFGKSCSDVCPKYCHNNECDRTSGICLSCVTGYYSENKTCTRCPDNCAACDSNNFCFTCRSGFRGTVCKDLCSNCKPNTSCDKITGYCLESCIDGLSGELCDMKCDSKCKSCDRFNLHECTSCEDDESGVLCKEACFSRCLKRLCNDSDESCTYMYDCLSENREGKSCNKTCLTYCKDRVCNITCNEKGKKQSSILVDNMYMIVGIGVGSVVFVAALSAILIWIKLRKHQLKGKEAAETEAAAAAEEEEEEEEKEETDDTKIALEPLNPKKHGLVNTSSPTTPISNAVECVNVKNDDCRDVDNFGWCINPIFINCNGDENTEGYIASFGTIDTFINGFGAFWEMVWREQCGKVVILSSKDTEDSKFERYFSGQQQHGKFTVTCKEVRDFGKNKYRIRVLKINTQTQEREVALFHFLTWPYQGIPELVSSILEFQKKVNDYSTKLKGPTVVHLSAGVHHRATYIALDMLTKKNKLVNKDDVRQCIADLGKRGLEVIFEQIWNLVYLADITATSDVDTTKKEVPSKKKIPRTKGNSTHTSIDVSANKQRQQPMRKNKDQWTPK